MEQRIQELEQEKLGKFLEIANVPTDTNEEAKNVVENLAATIKQPKDGIKITRRLHARKDLPAKILVELRDEVTQEKWLTEVKSLKPYVADVHPACKNIKYVVYVREAMTQLNKQLLWNAKQELKTKQNYKYVWFKKGYVKAKRDDNEKIYTIRSNEDIQALTTKKK
ncbi:unnamed protein product [Arctia plantaginis]|uniref:Uncharacterized protein n=1 Tax=Arctia plantaginis TaxID=874455 RepID=A0A8S1BRZ6_ARCPL|nr:unnamed protein product [Arctia plantaginis]